MAPSDRAAEDSVTLVPMRGDAVALARRARREPPEVVVVTGASAGVGRAVVRRFASEGASIGLIARGLDRLEGTRAEVEALGGRALVLPGDVADPAAIDAAAARVEESLGPIDIWINNATVTVFSPIKEMTAEEFRRVTEVTYLGYVHGTMAALRHMLPRGRGTIVQVGSALAYRGIPLQSAYCAAKHAIEGFTEALRCELLHDGAGVHATMVHLPAVNTPQFEWNKTRLPGHPQPVPPIFQPEVVAEAIHFAAHHRRREMLVGWPTLKAVYGNRVAPWYADRQLATWGYEAQQLPEPVAPDRPHNLWAPLPGETGAHGRFDASSRDFSPQLWASMHRGWLALGAALAATAAFTWRSSRSPRSRDRRSRRRSPCPPPARP
jgi:NAD(P)-dependent dehydrogenase (short-subunit alcohol dehydrogenase family)